jgi:hypothetical protein
VLFKKVIVIALSAVLALPLAGQQLIPVSSEFMTPGYGPVTELARLSAQSAPQPGTAAPQAASAESTPAAEPTAPAGKLTIEVLAGENAQNDIKARTATAPKVKVLDESGSPVDGAEVVFSLPMGGPSGIFSGWVRSQTLRTDVNGEAEVSAYQPNEIEGQFALKVKATSGNNVGAAIISQANVLPAAKKSNKKWIIIGAIAAGAAIAIAVAAASGDDDASPGQANPVTVSSGPISVGSPNN